MRYDRGDSFPFEFQPKGIPFGSKSKEKVSPRSYPIQFERKWNTSFLSVSLKLNVQICIIIFYQREKIAYNLMQQYYSKAIYNLILITI